MFLLFHLTASVTEKKPSRGVLKKRCSENMQQICREHSCRSMISIKLQSNFMEITLQHGCSPVNFLHIFRTPLPKSNSGWLLLYVFASKYVTDILDSDNRTSYRQNF